jgi:hypothetical protein
VGDPLDASDAFYAPITITNNFIPLGRTSILFGLCEVGLSSGVMFGTYGPGTPCTQGGPPVYFKQKPRMSDRYLAMDDKWRILFTDIDPFADFGKFAGGEVRFVLRYTPWPVYYVKVDWLFEREKQFKFAGRIDGNGSWRWYPEPIK